MRYLVIDAMLNSTGIRDAYNTGDIKPESLNLSNALIEQLNNWLLQYRVEFYAGYTNTEVIDELDSKGKELALMIKKELGEVKVEYFSDAKLTREVLF